MENIKRYFIDTLKNKYADFNGKATRSEYWYYVLFYILFSIALAFVDTLVLNPMLGMTTQEASQGGMLQMIFSLGLLIPSIAIAVRRFHDISMSGWWILIGLIPILGFLALIYFFVQKSK
jgi:uncharacterized membrane protein YhaH (DUF805 family)